MWDRIATDKQSFPSFVSHILNRMHYGGVFIMEGYVYILSNESMPGIYKIGCTSKTVKERIDELSRSTGVPTPFTEEASYYVFDMMMAESKLHQELAQYRVSSNKEFFKVDLPVILATTKILYKSYEEFANKIRDDVLEVGSEYFKEHHKGFLNNNKNLIIKKDFNFTYYKNIFKKNGNYYMGLCYTKVCSESEFKEWALEVIRQDKIIGYGKNTNLRVAAHTKKYRRKITMAAAV
jgi:hypothetical protein